MNEQAQTMEQVLLQRVETALLTVTQGVTELKVGQATLQNKQDLLNTKLFGDATSENDAGRLPRVEFLASTTASALTEYRDRFAREVIRDGPKRVEELEKIVIRNGEDRLASLERGQVKFATITAIAGALAGMLAALAMKLLFHV